MSRLYVWVENDKEQQRTLRGNTSITTQINYGSRDNSKKAVYVSVMMNEDDTLPVIDIRVSKGLLYDVKTY